MVNGVSCEKAQAFLDGGDQGPDPDDLQWDFNHAASSGWNKAVISCLIQRLKAMRQVEQWMTQPKSNEYWEDAISQKFACIKTHLSGAKPRVCDDNSMETEQETVERLVKQKAEFPRKARRDE